MNNNFKVWKTIKLGTHKNTNELCKELEKAGFKIGRTAYGILNKSAFTVASSKEEIDLINLSVEELGFKNGAKYGDIRARAKELNLKLCPAEVGPQLRLQYKDQLKGEWLRIAMEAIYDSDNNLNLFSVSRHNGSGWWLICNSGSSQDFWGPNCCFVFTIPKS